jgi:hypothetical protein
MFCHIRLYIALALALAVSGASLAQVNVPTGGVVNVPAGSMNLACAGLNVQGTYNVGTGQVQNTGDVGIAATGTVNGGQGTLRVTGNWNNLGNFVAGTSTVLFTDGCAVGPQTLSGNSVFYNLTLSSTNGQTFVLPAGSNITVLGVLTLQGASGNPIQLTSSSGQTALITFGPAAQLVNTNANVNGNVQFGNQAQALAIPTLSEYGVLLLSLLMAGTLYWLGRSANTDRNKEND